MRSKSIINYCRILTSSLAIFLISCTLPAKNKINDTLSTQQTASPDGRPFDAITDFTESLQCMDDYLIRYKVKDLSILVVEDRDVTGQVVGAKDMAVTALSKMARKSKSIRVISIGPAHATGMDAYIAGVGDRVPPNSDRRMLPKYYVTISMPQIDNAVSADRKSAGMRLLNAAGFEYDQDKLMSSMSIDLNMGNLLTASSLPGVYSSNTVAIKRTGKAIGANGEINKLGAVFNVSADRSEGFHHSLRQLVELGVIELIGRLTQLPYWECLNIATSNQPVQRQIQDWYESLSPSEFIIYAKNKLQAEGLYHGPLNGTDNYELRKAISRFRENRGLLPSPNLDGSLFRALLSTTTTATYNLAYLTQQKSELATKLRATEKALFSRTKPMRLNIDIGGKSTFSPGHLVNAKIDSGIESYVYCFYQQIGGHPIKLFPNRFRPHALLKAGNKLAIPGDDHFNIRTDKSGDIDTLMCIASYEDIEKHLPPIADLQQSELFTDLKAVYRHYRQTALDNHIALPLVKSVRIKVK